MKGGCGEIIGGTMPISNYVVSTERQRRQNLRCSRVAITIDSLGEKCDFTYECYCFISDCLCENIANYAVYLTFPAAALIGVVGYNLERLVSSKSTPSRENTIDEERKERQLQEMSEKDCTELDSITDRQSNEKVNEKH
ncbi:hypothetical protein CHUAL_004337 [Chamberlinius hualienensis]